MDGITFLFVVVVAFVVVPLLAYVSGKMFAAGWIQGLKSVLSRKGSHGQKEG